MAAITRNAIIGQEGATVKPSSYAGSPMFVLERTVDLSEYPIQFVAGTPDEIDLIKLLKIPLHALVLGVSAEVLEVTDAAFEFSIGDGGSNLDDILATTAGDALGVTTNYGTIAGNMLPDPDGYTVYMAAAAGAATKGKIKTRISCLSLV